MHPLYKRLSDDKLNPIQEALARRNLSVTEFARRMGITRPFASRVVNGTTVPSKGMAEDVAELLGIDPADVMWPYGRERMWRLLREERLSAEKSSEEEHEAQEDG